MIASTPFKLGNNSAVSIVPGDERRRYFLLDNYRHLDKDIKFVLISCKWNRKIPGTPGILMANSKKIPD